jgi:catechol 2,3-dioxygenase-like lactoylglutathione lyase family enzyme
MDSTCLNMSNKALANEFILKPFLEIQEQIMITAITHVVRYIPNEDQALAFYRDMLDFQVKMDNLMGAPEQRWLTMNLPAQPNMELVLINPNGWFKGQELENVLAQIGKQPQLILATDDIEALYAKLKTAKVSLETEINTVP